MAFYFNVLNNSSCLLPATSVSGDWLSRLDQARKIREPFEKSRRLIDRIQAVFVNVMVVPLFACGAFGAIVCYDLPSRLALCFDQSATEQNKVHLSAMTIFLGTILMRVGCYLFGNRELLFPVDYKNKGFSYELDPILEMVKEPHFQEPFIREKMLSRGDEADPVGSEEAALERFFCRVAHQEGGVGWLRQVPTQMMKRETLERQEFEFLFDHAIRRDKYELVAEIFDLPRNGFEVDVQDLAARARPEWSARQKFYCTVLRSEGGLDWLRGVPAGVINGGVLNQEKFLFLLQRIIQSNRFELLSLLLDLPRERMELMEPLKEIMAIAIERRDRELIHRVVAAGFQIDTNVTIEDQSSSALSAVLRKACSSDFPPAIRREYLDLADFLIREKEARIDAGVPSAWDVVEGFRNIEAAQFLFERGFRYDVWRQIDCLMTNLSLLEFILRLGINLGFRNKNNETFLLRAIRKDQVDALRLFLHYGADPNERDSQWPIEMALMKRNREAVEELVRYGAKLNVGFTRLDRWGRKNDQADTPLTYAVSIQDAGLVRLFLQKKADRDQRRWDEEFFGCETPLQIAHRLRNKELIALLSDQDKEAVRLPKEVANQGQKQQSFFERIFSKNLKALGSKGLFGDDDRKESHS